MINVVVGGATGKLGRLVCDLIAGSEDMKLVGATVSPEGGNIGKELYPGVTATGPGSLPEILRNADVYVDLTTPDAASKVIADVPSYKVNLILGTTAVPKDVIDRVAENVRRNGTSALVSANFSIGVNVFWKICGEIADRLPDYDIEIVEAHHGAKKDSPSGTTLETLRILQESSGIEKVVNGRCGVTGPRSREIGIHAIRAGDIIGDHTVIFAKNMEELELTHKAISRETFAKGCMESIRWMYNRKDGRMHSMSEVLDL